MSEGDQRPTKKACVERNESPQELALQVASDVGHEVVTIDGVYSDSDTDDNRHGDHDGAAFLRQCQTEEVGIKQFIKIVGH